MRAPNRQIYLIRHGETTWALEGKHTGVSDIPLTPHGEKQATLLKSELKKFPFEYVFTSPLKRALSTCELAGLLEQAVIDPDLSEWNYGKYEGLTTAQIHMQDPSWSIFSKGAPGGESVEEVCKRADRVLEKINTLSGDIALFSSGHFLRLLATRWIQLAPITGSHLVLFPASVSILGFERKTPAVLLWNQCIP